MQIIRNSDGGFACHNITHVSEKLKISAWYDKHGSLVDAEYITENDTACAIPERWVHVFKRLNSIGGAYSI